MATTVKLNVAYIHGHSLVGQYKLSLNKKGLERFKKLPLDEQKQYLRNFGKLIKTSWEVDEVGEEGEIKIEE